MSLTNVDFFGGGLRIRSNLFSYLQFIVIVSIKLLSLAAIAQFSDGSEDGYEPDRLCSKGYPCN